ncbi:MAG: hypothetical protein HRT89_01110 [Lentisphaeria bacterium]|nr:hypothetical protein [Lentisphaeria bacterium]
MKLILELSHLKFPAFHEFVALLDGIAFSGEILNNSQNWEDAVDSMNLPLHFIPNILPPDIASKLVDLNEAQQLQFFDHALSILKRSTSLDVKTISFDPGLEFLLWPGMEEMNVEKNTLSRRRLIKTFLTTIREQSVSLAIPLRIPMPRVARHAGDFMLKFLKSLKAKKTSLMLNVYYDELKDDAPEQLDDYLSKTSVIRIFYEPELGVIPDDAFHTSWASYLVSKKYKGSVVFAPKITRESNSAGELSDLAGRIRQFWR